MVIEFGGFIIIIFNVKFFVFIRKKYYKIRMYNNYILIGSILIFCGKIF